MTTPHTSRPSRSSRSFPHTLTARCPEDLLAVARVVLGFEPAGSVVMLTIGDHQFHARVDLPRSAADLEVVVSSLVDPAVRHRVEASVLLLYTEDAATGRRVARGVRRGLERAGVGVVDAIRVHDGRWYPLLRDRNGLGETGVPYDISAHPFVAAAVLEGRVLHESRDHLAATLVRRPEQVAAVAAARPTAPADAAWVGAQLDRYVGAAQVPDPPGAARLLEAVADPAVREAAWCRIRCSDSREHVRLWSDLVRRAPVDLLAHAASVLAFAAWVDGDGALAWCAVDAAREVDPGHPLAELVASLLLGAVPPGEWEQMRPGGRSAS